MVVIDQKYAGDMDYRIYKICDNGVYSCMEVFPSLEAGLPKEGTITYHRTKTIQDFVGINDLAVERIHRAVVDMRRGRITKRQIRRLLSE